MHVPRGFDSTLRQAHGLDTRWYFFFTTEGTEDTERNLLVSQKCRRSRCVHGLQVLGFGFPASTFVTDGLQFNRDILEFASHSAGPECLQVKQAALGRAGLENYVHEDWPLRSPQ